MNAAPVKYHLGKFPPKNLDWSRLIELNGPARTDLGRYDGLLMAIPNVHVLLSPLITQEAVLSSKIEGTHVTIGEVLEIEAGAESEALTQPKRAEAEEVLNYRKAMHACTKEVGERPLSQHTLRAAHSILMQGVRGRDRSPGSYRKEQNWIGRKGTSIEKASFIPIAPEHLQQGMDDWERYLRSDSEKDALIQAAIVHVEFESLHPFLDGNGRLGRMLIPLYLFKRKLLSSPDFYMSGYFESHRDEYQEQLRAVSRDNDWTGWCAFFLKGIREQAAENERKARAILELYERMKHRVVELTHSQHAIRAVDFIFQMPIFAGPQFTGHSKIPKPTAARILKILNEKGILFCLRQGRGRRSGFFIFRELMNIAEGSDVF